MSDFLDVINAFSTPLKVAWVGWIAWGVGQYFWFRYERSTPAKRVTSVATPAARKTASAKPAPAKAARAEAPEPPVVGRLITPSHVASEPKPRPATSASEEPAGRARQAGRLSSNSSARSRSKLATYVGTDAISGTPETENPSYQPQGRLECHVECCRGDTSIGRSPGER